MMTIFSPRVARSSDGKQRGGCMHKYKSGVRRVAARGMALKTTVALIAASTLLGIAAPAALAQVPAASVHSA